MIDINLPTCGIAFVFLLLTLKLNKTQLNTFAHFRQTFDFLGLYVYPPSASSARLALQSYQALTKQIARHGQQWGYDGEGMKILRSNLAAYQNRTEELIQEADHRLSYYRNIVLMKGRM